MRYLRITYAIAGDGVLTNTASVVDAGVVRPEVALLQVRVIPIVAPGVRVEGLNRVVDDVVVENGVAGRGGKDEAVAVVAAGRVPREGVAIRTVEAKPVKAVAAGRVPREVVAVGRGGKDEAVAVVSAGRVPREGVVIGRDVKVEAVPEVAAGRVPREGVVIGRGEKGEAVASYHLAKNLAAVSMSRDIASHLQTVLRLGQNVSAGIRRCAQRRLEIASSRDVAVTEEQCPVCRDDNSIDYPRFLATDAYMPAIENIYCVAAYRSGYDPQRADKLSKAIRAAKYSRDVCRGLGDLLGRCVSRHTPEEFRQVPDLIVPVPSSPDRYAERRYSIADELSSGVEISSGIPIFSSAVRMTRSTHDLPYLGRADRKIEIAGAFEIADPEIISGANVLLVDDVTTHGTTLLELARVIK